MSDARALEQLRQERETFDQAKVEAEQWSKLRLRMGYVGIAALIGVAIVSGSVIMSPSRYPAAVITLAATTLLIDILGLSISIFKLVLRQGSGMRLRPVTCTHRHRR